MSARSGPLAIPSGTRVEVFGPEDILLIQQQDNRAQGLSHPLDHIILSAAAAGETIDEAAERLPGDTDTLDYFLRVEELLAVGIIEESNGSANGQAPLPASGVTVAKPQDLELPIVLLTNNYLHVSVRELLSEVNSPVLLVRSDAKQLWLGPVLHQTSCWSCVESRLLINSPVDEFLRQHQRPVTAEDPEQQPTWLTRNDFRQQLSVEDRDLLDNFLRTDSQEQVIVRRDSDGVVTRHLIDFAAGCDKCGSKNDDQGPSFGSGLRRWSNEYALQQLGHLVDPLIGHVQRESIVAGPPHHSFFLAAADFRFVRHDSTVQRLLRHGPKTNAGKGWSPESARLGALGESLERIAAAYTGDEQVRQASAAELGLSAIQPSEFSLFSEKQIEHRMEWNKERSNERDLRHYVPRPLDPQEVIPWCELQSLTGGASRWFPAAACCFNYPQPDGHNRGVPVIADSNGCAAGADVTEATAFALLELVQRDAVGIWWYNRRSVARLPHMIVSGPGREAIDNLRGQGQDVWFLDITSDLGVPTVVALSAESGRHIGYGFASSWSLASAADDALLELLQIIQTARRRQGRPEESGTLMSQWWREAILDDQPFLRGVAAPAAADLHEAEPSAAVLVDDILQRLQGAGIEPFILDLTRPSYRLSVVRTFAPGLRHIWRRHGPGRLYDAFESDMAASEADLNPWTIWI